MREVKVAATQMSWHCSSSRKSFRTIRWLGAAPGRLFTVAEISIISPSSNHCESLKNEWNSSEMLKNAEQNLLFFLLFLIM